MTEGARSFRRRGALALRFSPETGARQKRAAKRSKRDGPSLGGFDPRYLVQPRRLGLEAIRADQIPSLFWAASLQLLDVTALPVAPKPGPKKQDKRSGAKALRRAPQTMPQRAWLFLKGGQRELPRANFSGSKLARARPVAIGVVEANGASRSSNRKNCQKN